MTLSYLALITWLVIISPSLHVGKLIAKLPTDLSCGKGGSPIGRTQLQSVMTAAVLRARTLTCLALDF